MTQRQIPTISGNVKVSIYLSIFHCTPTLHNNFKIHFSLLHLRNAVTLRKNRVNLNCVYFFLMSFLSSIEVV